MEMSVSQDQANQLLIKFRLIDGTDIGPKEFPPATLVRDLKEAIPGLWPKGKENGPKEGEDVKLISGGKILDNNTTLEQCNIALYGNSGVTTMHAVIKQPPQDTDKEMTDDPKQGRIGRCHCVIQ